MTLNKKEKTELELRRKIDNLESIILDTIM